MPLVARGYDASWSPPDPACMKNAGYSFACRYSSSDPSKNLSKSELDKLMSLGMSVCVVHQDGKDQMSRGYSGGQADARTADAFVTGLGMAGMPVYFSCDKDFEACTSSQKSAVDAYCDGVVSVIGLARSGGYGDDSFCARQFDAGRITFGWQTRSWSEGMWEPRAQLRQVKFDFPMCGGTIDDDEARAVDHGQWPRPPAGQDGAGDVTVACVTWQDRTYYAGLGAGGEVRFAEPGADWYAVDPSQSGARSGCGLAITPAGRTTISYTNGRGAACIYERQPGGGAWGWASISPDDSFR